MSRVYAIDPGTEQSAIVCVEDNAVKGWILPNTELVRRLRVGVYLPQRLGLHVVIEQVESYGMPVGREVFDTVFWSGRFAQAWSDWSALASWSLLPRKTVKLTLCGTVKAKDANIRQALIDLYGGSACVRKGGALAGIKSHLWAALALAVTYQRMHTDARSALLASESGKPINALPSAGDGGVAQS